MLYKMHPCAVLMHPLSPGRLPQSRAKCSSRGGCRVRSPAFVGLGSFEPGSPHAHKCWRPGTTNPPRQPLSMIIRGICPGACCCGRCCVAVCCVAVVLCGCLLCCCCAVCCCAAALYKCTPMVYLCYINTPPRYMNASLCCTIAPPCCINAPLCCINAPLCCINVPLCCVNTTLCFNLLS